MTNVQKTKLAIKGMHCTSCAMNIDFDLEDLKGVIITRTHYARQECSIEFDADKITIEAILDQIKKSGYEASVQS